MNERDVLLWLLDARDFPGRDALRAQAETAVVVGYCSCGCGSVDLEVDPSTPAAPGARSPLPNEADVLDEAGEPIGGVILFLTEGRLSLLEIFSYFDPIPAFPPLARLRLSNR